MSRPYRVICISMYEDDLAELDRLIAELRRRRVTRANRSAIIRAALTGVSADWIERLINAEEKG